MVVDQSPEEGSISEPAKYRVIDCPGPGEIRLIDDEGSQVGVLTIEAAIEIAREKELDLVELNPNAVPPICKLMDFGKFKYNASKKTVKTKVRKRKEVKLKPKIEQHDFDVKLRRAKSFIEEGHKVLVTMVFRGREQRHPEIGREVLKRFAADLEDVAKLERMPSQEASNRMSMVLTGKG